MTCAPRFSPVPHLSSAMTSVPSAGCLRQHGWKLADPHGGPKAWPVSCGVGRRLLGILSSLSGNPGGSKIHLQVGRSTASKGLETGSTCSCRAPMHAIWMSCTLSMHLDCHAHQASNRVLAGLTLALLGQLSKTGACIIVLGLQPVSACLASNLCSAQATQLQPCLRRRISTISILAQQACCPADRW